MKTHMTEVITLGKMKSMMTEVRGVHPTTAFPIKTYTESKTWEFS